MRKVIIHKDKCINCGTCTALAEEFFSPGSESVEIIKQPQTKEDWQKVNDAIAACPNSAIEIIEN